MSRIDDLIAEHCPDGVEFRPLRDVGQWYGGGTPSKAVSKYWTNGTVPWLSPKDMDGGTVQSTGLCVSEVALRDSPLRLVPGGSVAFVVRSNVLRRRLPVAKVPFETTLNQDMRAVVPCEGVLLDYLAQVCRSNADAILSSAGRTDGTMAAIRGPGLLDFRVPIPPVEVQREIAHTLGKWDSLCADLDAEVVLRGRLQAELARRLIETSRTEVSTHGGLERVRLGDIATQFVEPVRVEPDRTYLSLGVKWYGEGVFARDSRAGSSIKGSTLYKVKPGQLIFNRMFVTEGSFAVVPEGLSEGVVSNEFPVYELDGSRVLREWLLLYLLDEYTLKRIEAETTGTERGSMKSRRRWREQQFESFEISLPPVEVQQRAAHTLGTASRLATAVREERAARHEQYVYYRDLVLAFRKKNAGAAA